MKIDDFDALPDLGLSSPIAKNQKRNAYCRCELLLEERIVNAISTIWDIIHQNPVPNKEHLKVDLSKVYSELVSRMDFALPLTPFMMDKLRTVVWNVISPKNSSITNIENRYTLSHVYKHLLLMEMDEKGMYYDPFMLSPELQFKPSNLLLDHVRKTFSRPGINTVHSMYCAMGVVSRLLQASSCQNKEFLQDKLGKVFSKIALRESEKYPVKPAMSAEVREVVWEIISHDPENILSNDERWALSWIYMHLLEIEKQVICNFQSNQMQSPNLGKRSEITDQDAFFDFIGSIKDNDGLLVGWKRIIQFLDTEEFSILSDAYKMPWKDPRSLNNDPENH